MLHSISPRVAARQAARDAARDAATYAPIAGPNRKTRRARVEAPPTVDNGRSNRPDAQTLPITSARRARRTRVRQARKAGRDAR